MANPYADIDRILHKWNGCACANTGMGDVIQGRAVTVAQFVSPQTAGVVKSCADKNKSSLYDTGTSQAVSSLYVGLHSKIIV